MNLLDQLFALLKQHGITLNKVRRNSTMGGTTGDVLLIDEIEQYAWAADEIDEDLIATKFYGPGADSNTNAYKKMKQRLVDRLTEKVINLSVHATTLSPLQKGFYSAHREYVVATILIGRGASNAGAYFLRRALNKAVKYDAVKIEMLALYALRGHAAASEKNLRKFQEYSLRYKAAMRRLRATNEVVEYYHGLTIIYDASPKTLSDIHLRALEYLVILDEKYKVDEFGYLYAFVYFQLKMLSRYAASQYEEAILVADEATAYFLALPFDYSAQQVVFLMHKVVFYTLLQHYEKGMEAYRECTKHMGVNEANWGRLQEAAFRLLMYRKWYDQAYLIYIKVASTGSYADILERRSSRWRVNRAYLYYLKEAGRVNFDLSSDPLGKFKLGKFMNSVSPLDKQKEGNNIPILIVHILFMIQRGNHREGGERIEALEKYLTRYLRRGENYRSKCFIKILQQFAKGDFNSDVGRRRTRSWYSKLLASPINLSSQSYEIEIIPYEDLYMVMMGIPTEV